MKIIGYSKNISELSFAHEFIRKCFKIRLSMAQSFDLRQKFISISFLRDFLEDDFLLHTGANAIFTTKSIDVASLEPIVKFVSENGLKYIARATGATIFKKLVDGDTSHKFNKAWLGIAQEIEHVVICDNEMTVRRGCTKEDTASVHGFLDPDLQ